MALHDDTVTVLQRTAGPPDADGVTTYTTTRHVLEGVNVQPVGTDESIGEQEPITSRWRLSTASPEDWISSGDQVEWRGVVHDVRGRPQTFWHMRPHTELVMTDTKG